MDDLINKKVLLREMTKLYNERKVEATMTGNRACGATWDDAVLLVVLAPAVVTEPSCRMKYGMTAEEIENKLTKSEAITIISDIRSEYNYFEEERKYHALSMAIEALRD